MNEHPEARIPRGRADWLDGKAVARLLVGSALGALTLWLTFRGTDLSIVARSLGRIHPVPVLAALAIVAVTVTVVGWRWELLVHARGGARALPRFVAAVLISQMINILLPIRLGDVMRAYWISRTQFQPLSRILATIAVEHLADVLMLGVSLSVLLLGMSLPVWASSSGRMALIVSVGAAVCALAIGTWGSSLLRILERPLVVLPARFRLLLLRQSQAAIAELRAFGDWRTNGAVWALSVLVLVLAAATNYVLFRAFDLPLSPQIALLLFIVLQIGSVPVSTPGNLGVYHYLVVLVLTAFGVDRTVAIAYAIVLHAVALGSKILAGALILATTRTPVFDRSAWKQPALEAAEPASR